MLWFAPSPVGKTQLQDYNPQMVKRGPVATQRAMQRIVALSGRNGLSRRKSARAVTVMVVGFVCRLLGRSRRFLVILFHSAPQRSLMNLFSTKSSPERTFEEQPRDCKKFPSFLAARDPMTTL